MASLSFSHVALNCQDPLVTERFYTQHFGFRRARVVPMGEQQLVFLRSGGVMLELFKSEGERATVPSDGDGPHNQGVRHIAFQTEDIDAVLSSMAGEVEVTLGPLDFGDFIPNWRTAWVRDPDGVIVEISQGYFDQEDPPDARH